MVVVVWALGVKKKEESNDACEGRKKCGRRGRGVQPEREERVEKKIKILKTQTHTHKQRTSRKSGKPIDNLNNNPASLSHTATWSFCLLGQLDDLDTLVDSLALQVVLSYVSNNKNTRRPF